MVFINSSPMSSTSIAIYSSLVIDRWFRFSRRQKENPRELPGVEAKTGRNEIHP